MKIFITGGTGFIGSYLVKRLRGEGLDVCVLSRAGSGEKVIEGDLANLKEWKEEVKKFRPEAVIHLAWEGIPDTSKELAKKNITQGLGLIELAGKIGCKTFMGTGSALEYDGLEGKVKEGDEGAPPNPLYQAKKERFQEGKRVAKKYGMRFIWTRPFYVYGPGQREEALIPHLIASLKKGEAIDIKNPDGANDFVYIKDVADALALLLEKDAPQGAYNIGSGHLTSVREMVGVVAKALNVPAPKLPPYKNSSHAFFADIARIEQATGWRPRTSLEKGIKSTIA